MLIYHVPEAHESHVNFIKFQMLSHKSGLASCVVEYVSSLLGHRIVSARSIR